MPHTFEPMIVANWKMYGHQAMLASYMTAFGAACSSAVASLAQPISTVFCPPAPYLLPMKAAVSGLPKHDRFKDLWATGGQTCAAADKDGPATGEISPGMLKDCGCAYVILGHSERRRNQGETDSLIAAKALSAMTAGLVPIICIGETEAQAQGGLTEAILTAQITALASLPSDGPRLVIAYEPVWAIGTGRTPSLEEIAARHSLIRQTMQENRLDGHILYGGSVKAANAAAILATPDVNGVLVGGASLDPAEFAKIAFAASAPGAPPVGAPVGAKSAAH